MGNLEVGGKANNASCLSKSISPPLPFWHGHEVVTCYIGRGCGILNNQCQSLISSFSLAVIGLGGHMTHPGTWWEVYWGTFGNVLFTNKGRLIWGNSPLLNRMLLCLHAILELLQPLCNQEERPAVSRGRQKKKEWKPPCFWWCHLIADWINPETTAQEFLNQFQKMTYSFSAIEGLWDREWIFFVKIQRFLLET